jgi:hypothetical protein
MMSKSQHVTRVYVTSLFTKKCCVLWLCVCILFVSVPQPSGYHGPSYPKILNLLAPYAQFVVTFKSE